MILKSKNVLVVSFVDDGNGLDDSINIDDVFDLGITSTSGSGLGLFHVKQILDSMDSEIELIPCDTKGVEMRMTFTK